MWVKGNVLGVSMRGTIISLNYDPLTANFVVEFDRPLGPKDNSHEILNFFIFNGALTDNIFGYTWEFKQ